MSKIVIYSIFILLSAINLHAQKEDNRKPKYSLTSLTKKIVSEFIVNQENSHQIDPTKSSIVLFFVNDTSSDKELIVGDCELVFSCVKQSFIMNAYGFNIFYSGKVNPKYLLNNPVEKKQECAICDSLLIIRSEDNIESFKEYNGNFYVIKKGTTINNLKMSREQ